jgi:hypothetical protein
LCEEPLRVQGEWLADLLHSLDPVEGTAVEVGWSILKFAIVDGELTVCEPDFSGNPLQSNRPDVSTSLKVQLAQNSVLSRLKVEGLPARFDQKVVVWKGSLEEGRIVAQRQNPAPGDTGWYIAPARVTTAPTPDDLEAFSSFELLRRRPELLQVLALPVGWLTIWNAAALESVVDENDEERPLGAT